MNPIVERSYSPVQTTDTTPENVPKTADRDEPSPFAVLARSFASEADKGDKTVHQVLDAAGRHVPLDPTSLLALQAGIYRYGETMDIAARLVDKVSTGAKTILQGS